MARRKRTERDRAKLAAKRTPAWMQDVAFSKNSGELHQAFRTRRMGKFGAASPVRIIDPTGSQP